MAHAGAFDELWGAGADGHPSFDSTIRSNIAVARPLDLMIMRSDPQVPLLTRRIEADDVYFNDLSSRWSSLLREGTRSIPDPDFLEEQSALAK